jgi:hypothetical protein
MSMLTTVGMERGRGRPRQRVRAKGISGEAGSARMPTTLRLAQRAVPRSIWRTMQAVLTMAYRCAWRRALVEIVRRTGPPRWCKQGLAGRIRRRTTQEVMEAASGWDPLAARASPLVVDAEGYTKLHGYVMVQVIMKSVIREAVGTKGLLMVRGINAVARMRPGRPPA